MADVPREAGTAHKLQRLLQTRAMPAADATDAQVQAGIAAAAELDPILGALYPSEVRAIFAAMVEAGSIAPAAVERNESVKRDAARYAYLRSRPLNTIERGGVFAGLVPQNVVINGDDLDAAVDAALQAQPTPAP